MRGGGHLSNMFRLCMYQMNRSFLEKNGSRGTKSDGCGAHLFIVYIVVLPARAGREFFEGKGGFFQHV